MKNVFIETYGCQMNEYDTELVKAILSKANYSFTDDETGADIVMLNTCAIREHAHRKVYGRVHEIKHKRAQSKGHRAKDDVKIGILGCMATNLRTDLLENRNLKIDFIAGPDSYKRLPQLIKQAYATGEKQFDLTLSEFETYSDIFTKAKGDSPHSGTAPRKSGVNAWIAVMRGCNNFCTFCVVPYTRGRERSRSPENVVDEVKRLADEGFKQVTLLGQNVNSYKHQDADFAHLLEKVSKVAGIERIRFTSPHPKDFPRHLLKVIADNPKLCKQIHLPLQAGSNRVLDLMARSYTKEEFYELVDEIRAAIPGVALSTDVIVGFCSETDGEFEETLEVIRNVEFDSAFMFKYSQREQTIAKRKFEDDVPEAIKTERIVALNELQKEISYKKNQEHIGQQMAVMIEEERSKKSPERAVARADNNKIVLLPQNGFKKGTIVTARIKDASPFNLKGEHVLS